MVQQQKHLSLSGGFGLFAVAVVCYFAAFFTLNQFADFQNDTYAFGIGPLRMDGEYAKAAIALAVFVVFPILAAFRELGGIPNPIHHAAPTPVASPASLVAVVPSQSEFDTLKTRVADLEARVPHV